MPSTSTWRSRRLFRDDNSDEDSDEELEGLDFTRKRKSRRLAGFRADSVASLDDQEEEEDIRRYRCQQTQNDVAGSEQDEVENEEERIVTAEMTPGSGDGAAILNSHLEGAVNNRVLGRICSAFRPRITRTSFRWIPLVEEHIDRQILPDPYRDPTKPLLPRCSYLYSVTITSSSVDTRQDYLPSLIRESLIKNEWSISKLPTVHVFRKEGMARDTKLVLIQCQDVKTHMHWRRAGLLEQTLSGHYQTKYDFKLLDTGMRSGLEIFRADFSLLHRGDAPIAPIQHEVAARIAHQFAKSCAATSGERYPRATDGLLGLWRKQVDERFPSGHIVSCDENRWIVGLHIPKEVDRSSFLAYFTDEETDLRFQFVFPGSSKYCRAHADNSHHGDAACDLVSRTAWDADLMQC